MIRLRNAVIWSLLFIELAVLGTLLFSLLPIATVYWGAVRFIFRLRKFSSHILGRFNDFIHLCFRSSSESHQNLTTTQPGRNARKFDEAAPRVKILPGLEPVHNTAGGRGLSDLSVAQNRIFSIMNDGESPNEVLLISLAERTSPSKDKTDSCEGLPLLSLKSRAGILDDPDVQFMALCYVRGDRSDDVAVEFDGQSTKISSNLANAMSVCLGAFGSGNDTWIWTSEVCLDSQHVQERVGQEIQLRRIYQRAKKVVIWLGPADNQARCLFAFIRVWSRTLGEWKEWTGSLNPVGPELFAKLDEVVRTAWKSFGESLVARNSGSEESCDRGGHGVEGKPSEILPRKEGEGLSPVQALIDVFSERPYWSSDQESQEFCSLNDGLFLCDKDIVVGLSEISRVFLWMRNYGTILVEEERPATISEDVWDVVRGLVEEIPKLPLYRTLLLEST